MTSSISEPVSWTNDLLASLGSTDNPNRHARQITGGDPVIATRFRAGEAAAAVLAANAMAAAAMGYPARAARQRSPGLALVGSITPLAETN